MRLTSTILAIGLIGGLSPATLALSPEDVAGVIDPSVVRIYVEGSGRRGSGTGFVVSRDGHVVTNFHVVQAHLERGWAIFVARGGTGPEQRLAVTGIEPFPGEDLAILQVADLRRPPVRFAYDEPSDVDLDPVKGLQVYGIGFPGAADRLGPVTEASFSPGLVSRTFMGAWTGNAPQITIIQHTAPTNPGNSGGPLVNACGEVIGINAQREARIIAGPGGIPLVSDPIQGVFFSIQASVLLQKLEQLGIAYRRADTQCVTTAISNLERWLPYGAALVAMLVVALLVTLLRRRPLQIVVQCGDAVDNCVLAIRRALERHRS